jgi:CoA:oxalate CoA-transferase
LGRVGSRPAGRARRSSISLAPVRDVEEVMRDRPMHERGMLEWVEHDEIHIVVQTTPLRVHDADPVDTVLPGRHDRQLND